MRLRGVIALLAGCLVVGCIAPERAVVADVSPAAWQEPAVVAYTNRDTLSRIELRLFLRLDDRFREDTLTLRLTTLSPDSLRASEYHRLVIPARRVATPLQRVFEIPYRRGVQLHARGEYRFWLTPTRPIEGVEAVGITFNHE